MLGARALRRGATEGKRRRENGGKILGDSQVAGKKKSPVGGSSRGSDDREQRRSFRVFERRKPASRAAHSGFLPSPSSSLSHSLPNPPNPPNPPVVRSRKRRARNAGLPVFVEAQKGRRRREEEHPGKGPPLEQERRRSLRARVRLCFLFVSADSEPAPAVPRCRRSRRARHPTRCITGRRRHETREASEPSQGQSARNPSALFIVVPAIFSPARLRAWLPSLSIPVDGASGPHPHPSGSSARAPPHCRRVPLAALTPSPIHLPTQPQDNES
jgi:hypothetical protein